MRTKVDEKIFKAVKAMQAGGATANQISECLGVSLATVYRIAQANSFSEYGAPKKAPETAPTPTANAYINNRVYELIKQQNELLALISNKLAYIVEQLA